MFGSKPLVRLVTGAGGLRHPNRLWCWSVHMSSPSNAPRTDRERVWHYLGFCDMTVTIWQQIVDGMAADGVRTVAWSVAVDDAHSAFQLLRTAVATHTDVPPACDELARSLMRVLDDTLDWFHRVHDGETLPLDDAYESLHIAQIVTDRLKEQWSLPGAI